MKMKEKYNLPSFLSGLMTQKKYEHWLRRRAQAHVKRDRHRGNEAAIGELYRGAIHTAVKESLGSDAYTGERLDWELISRYSNDESQRGRRHYKRKFALLPTVDHVDDGKGHVDFRICCWRTNDAKNDLKLSEFISLCRSVLEHQGYIIKRDSQRLNR